VSDVIPDPRTNPIYESFCRITACASTANPAKGAKAIQDIETLRMHTGPDLSYHHLSRKSPRWGMLVLCALLLAGCVSDRTQTNVRPVVMAQRPVPQVYAPARPADRTRAPQALTAEIQRLGSSFRGRVGIAVRRVDADWEAAWNGNALMPQQSVSKLWVSMALLDAVDRGRLTLNDPVTVRPEDLTLFHQPIAQLVNKEGYRTTLSDLLTRALTQSDNTANDALLRRVGGPEAVRGFLARRFISNIRFGPGERQMQSAAAGLDWDQSLSRGRAFYAARDRLPMSVREKALDAYLASPPDGASASAIAQALARLKRGEMLSPASTAYVLATMHEAKTGPQRIKGGVPPGWSYAHKTGTGQDLPPRSTGFNDVGVITAPDGASYAVAVMIGSTTVSIPERWALMQSVARAVVANHQR
jgi:beta-lactamase class A